MSRVLSVGCVEGAVVWVHTIDMYFVGMGKVMTLETAVLDLHPYKVYS